MLLKTALFVLVVVVICFCSWLTVYSVTKDSNEINLLTLVSGLTFMILGFAFGLSGLFNNKRL